MRSGNIYPASALFGKPFFYGFLIPELTIERKVSGNFTIQRIIVKNKLRQLVVIAHRRIYDKILVVAKSSALESEQLEASPVAVGKVGDYVLVGNIYGNYLLLFGHFPDSGYLIPYLSRFLEIEVFGSLFHSFRKHFYRLSASAL